MSEDDEREAPQPPVKPAQGTELTEAARRVLNDQLRPTDLDR